MERYDWQDIDEALDRIEAGDYEAVAEVFLLWEGAVASHPDGRRERVTVSSFGRRARVPRHTMSKWVFIARQKQRQRAS
jgi:hypothetical protein